MIYLIKFIASNKAGYFLWGDENYEGDDLFYLNADGSDFVWAATLEEIIAIAQAKSSEDNLLSDEAGTPYDFAAFWRRLSEINAQQHSTSLLYKYLLNGWNHLENFARTIDIDLKKQETANTKSVAEEVYQKLIWGAELPAFMPAGKDNRPLWSEAELDTARQYLLAIWRDLRSVSNSFNELTEGLIK